MSERIYKMIFSKVYPMYVEKAEKKGCAKDEINAVVLRLTGYDEQGLRRQIEKDVNLTPLCDKYTQDLYNRAKSGANGSKSLASSVTSEAVLRVCCAAR